MPGMHGYPTAWHWHKTLLVAAVLLLLLQPRLSTSSARPIFQHWLQLVERHHAAVAPRIASHAGAMQAAGVPLLPAACIYLYTYTAVNRSLDFWPKEKDHACRMPTALERAHTFRAFISALILSSPLYSAAFKHDFSFLIDVIDGHRQSHVARSLGVPLLVLSKHPLDNYTLPFPDLYHALGLMALHHNRTGAPIGDLRYNWHKGAVEGRTLQTLALMASFRLAAEPWEARQSTAVYRGSCYSTANSSDASPKVQAFAARAQLARLCSLYNRRHAAPGLDTSSGSAAQAKAATQVAPAAAANAFPVASLLESGLQAKSSRTSGQGAVRRGSGIADQSSSNSGGSHSSSDSSSSRSSSSSGSSSDSSSSRSSSSSGSSSDSSSSRSSSSGRYKDRFLISASKASSVSQHKDSTQQPQGKDRADAGVPGKQGEDRVDAGVPGKQGKDRADAGVPGKQGDNASAPGGQMGTRMSLSEASQHKLRTTPPQHKEGGTVTHPQGKQDGTSALHRSQMGTKLGLLAAVPTNSKPSWRDSGNHSAQGSSPTSLQSVRGSSSATSGAVPPAIGLGSGLEPSQLDGRATAKEAPAGGSGDDEKKQCGDCVQQSGAMAKRSVAEEDITQVQTVTVTRVTQVTVAWPGKAPVPKQQRLERAAMVAAWGQSARKQREVALGAALHEADLPPGALDLGLNIRGYEATCINNTDAPKLCAACRFCFASSKPQIPLQDMLRYKYQILIDGYSAAWDSSLWKLGSNSTVFYVHPQQHHDGAPHQPWSLWWYPALEPGVHYVATTATDLPLQLARCLRSQERCRRMAEEAYQAASSRVSPDATLEYSFLVLKHLHDLQS